MQVWDQVKVKSGEFEGQAGVVQAFDVKAEVCTVKLDSHAEPVTVPDADLQFLGR